jgi:hypothetical protein
MVKRASWLSVTPEPERELPAAVATITAGRRAPAEAIGREQARVEQLVLHGSERRWIAYLHQVVELIEARSTVQDPDVAHARRRAAAVISNHHNLLLGLAGPGAKLTAQDRRVLDRLIAAEHDIQDRFDDPPAKGPQ